MKEQFFEKDSDKITIFRECTVTGKEYRVKIHKDEYESYVNGTLAQVAFPFLTAEQKEFIISNNTPAEWEEIFKGIDDEY